MRQEYEVSRLFTENGIYQGTNPLMRMQSIELRMSSLMTLRSEKC